MEVQDITMWTLFFTCSVYIVTIETKYVLELDDVMAAVNDKFVYTIGDQKFAQTYRIHRIVDRKTKSLPDWLSFDNATNILYGTPTSDDIGTYSIRMKATCIDPPNMECQDKISRSFQIRIIEPIKSADSRGRDNYRLHAWSEKHHGKYSLNLTSSLVTSASLTDSISLDSNSILMHDHSYHPYSASLHTHFQTTHQASSSSNGLMNSEIVNPCDNGVSAFYASLILHVEHDFTANNLYSNMLTFADFVSKPLHLISLTMSPNDILSMKMGNKHIITAGPGNVVASLKESMELSWHVNCGEFLHIEEFGRVLQHNIDVGRISKELDTDVIAWYLYSDQPVSLRRKRQANSRFRKTKTPTFSLVPFTSIIDVSSFILTESSESESSLISLPPTLFTISSVFETSISSFYTKLFETSFIDSRSLLPTLPAFSSNTLVSITFSSLSFTEPSFISSDEIPITLFTPETIDSSVGSFIDSSISSLSSFVFEVESDSSFSPMITQLSSFDTSIIKSFGDFTDLIDSGPILSVSRTSTSGLISSLDILSYSSKASLVGFSTLIIDSTLTSSSVVDSSFVMTRSSKLDFSLSAMKGSILSSSLFIEESTMSSSLVETSEMTSPGQFISSSSSFVSYSTLPSFSTITQMETKEETFSSQIISVVSDSTAASNLLISSQILTSSLFIQSFRPTISTSSFTTTYLSSIMSNLTSLDTYSLIEESTTLKSQIDADLSSILLSFPSTFQSPTVSSQMEIMSFTISITEDVSRLDSSYVSELESAKQNFSLSEIIETSFESSSGIESYSSEYFSSTLFFTTSEASLFVPTPSAEVENTMDLSSYYSSLNEFPAFSTTRLQTTPSANSFGSDVFVQTSFISQSLDTPALQSTEVSLFETSFLGFPETFSSLVIATSKSTILVQASLSSILLESSDTMLASSLDFFLSETLISMESFIITKTTTPLSSLESEILETSSSMTTSGMTITSNPSSSKVLMSSSPVIPLVPTDDPPFRQNSIDHLTIVFDKFFSYKIPANTFNDTEDGNTMNLTLSITLLFGKPIPIGAWLKFNSTSQTLYGIPLQQDIKNEDRFVERFVLIATDSQGQTTRDVISLSYSIEVLAITHSISLELDVDFSDFHLERQNLVDVAEMLASLYGNPNLKYLTFFDVRKGSAIVRWGNNSLFGSICYKDIINDVFSRIAFENGTLTAELEDLLSQYNPVSAKLELTGPCLLPQLTPLPPFDSPVGASDNDRMWIEILLPALVVILILVIIALVLLICCRHKKPSKEPQSDKPTFLEDRRPIIFPEELEMVDPSLKPKQPLILPRDYLTETPPAVPPHGLQDPPSYRVPEINEDIFRPGNSQTPPPPSYGNQSTSEPPAYRLPPPYYNPHRANIKT